MRQLQIPAIMVCTAVSILLSGCVAVKDTVYLESLTVKSPIEQPPVHLTIDPQVGQIHITPKFSSTGQQTLENRSIPLTFVGDTFRVAGNNFRWKIPSAQIGMDMDWIPINGFSVNFGFTVSAGEGSGLWGGNFGIGLPFQGDELGGRFEAGIQFQQTEYDAYSVLVRDTYLIFGGNQRQIIYFHDIGTSTPMNGYLTLTLNSHSEKPVNFFTSFTFSQQNLASFSPRTLFTVFPPLFAYEYTDARADHSASFLMFTPGLYFTLAPKMRLMAGARIMSEMTFDPGNDVFVAPMLQWDISL